jgi:hypothetical protein
MPFGRGAGNSREAQFSLVAIHPIIDDPRFPCLRRRSPEPRLAPSQVQHVRVTLYPTHFALQDNGHP